MSKNSPVKSSDNELNSQAKKSSRYSYHYSGPIPHPTVLMQYDTKTRETIVSMAQNQSLHRQTIEASVIAANIWNEKAGMFIAAFLTCFMIGGGVFLLMNDKNAIGFFLIFGPSLFHAGNYIYNKKQENEVKKEKEVETNLKN